MSNQSPFDALRLLTDRVRQELDKIGLSMVAAQFIPAEDGSDHMMIVAHIEQDTFKTPEELEKERTDADFSALVGDLTFDLSNEAEPVLVDKSEHDEEDDENEWRAEQIAEMKRQIKENLAKGEDGTGQA